MAGSIRRLTGTIVLDCEGLSKLADNHPEAMAKVKTARLHNTPVVISSLTIVEAQQRKHRKERMDWTISRLQVEPVTLEVAQDASTLLRKAGMTGQQHAIDAVVAATALNQPGPILLYTSDPGDLAKLCASSDRPRECGVKVIPI